MTERSVGAAPAAGRADGADRLFLAIALPEPLREALAEAVAAGTAGQSLPGRPVPPANWHLTLRFLGDTGREQRARLVALLRGTPLGPPFDATLAGWGAFPRPARGAVLWLGVADGAEPLAALAAALERAAVEAGWPREGRAFRGHLTLSRVRPPRDLRPTIASLPPFRERLAVDEVILFRSRIGHGPPRYEPLERFSLVIP